VQSCSHTTDNWTFGLHPTIKILTDEPARLVRFIHSVRRLSTPRISGFRAGLRHNLVITPLTGPGPRPHSSSNWKHYFRKMCRQLIAMKFGAGNGITAYERTDDTGNDQQQQQEQVCSFYQMFLTHLSISAHTILAQSSLYIITVDETSSILWRFALM